MGDSGEKNLTFVFIRAYITAMQYRHLPLSGSRGIGGESSSVLAVGAPVFCRGVAQLAERLVWGQEAVGAKPTTPTTFHGNG